MSLAKIVTTLSLALSLSTLNPFPAQGQVQLASRISGDPTELLDKSKKGIIKPSDTPELSADIKVQKGIMPAIKIGELEIRDKSMYASLLFGHYQILFEQENDSTFVEHLFTKSLSKDSERYEIFITKKRKDEQGNPYFILTEYLTTKGTPREEKIPLENKTYSSTFSPSILTLNQFLKNKLPEEVNMIVLGVTYNFNIYEKREPSGKNTTTVTKYAKMSEVMHTPDDSFLMEEYINLRSTETKNKNNGLEMTMMQPKEFEAKFTVINSGVWNGNYKAIGVVKDKQIQN